jgi:hypothetical protein
MIKRNSSFKSLFRYMEAKSLRNPEFDPVGNDLTLQKTKIIKLGERENLTLDKPVGCVACSKPAHKRQTTQEGSRK